MNGTPEGQDLHMSGLERLVMMRGGLENLGFNGQLRRISQWFDPTGTDKSLDVIS
jgi:hypothetical protein